MKIEWNEWFEEASLLHQKGDLEKARESYQAILKDNPHEPNTLHQLGLLCAQFQQFEEAVLFLEKAVQYQPSSSTFRNNLANALVAVKKFDEAKYHYQEIIQADPEYVQAYNNLGSLYLKQKNFDEAEKYFTQAIEKYADYTDAIYNLGLCLFKRGDYERAIEFFITAMFQEPERVSLRHYIAHCYYMQKNYDSAGREYQAILLNDPDNVEINYNFANVLMVKKYYQEAFEVFQKVLSLDPTMVDAHYNLGIIHSVNQNISLAISCFKKVIELDAHHIGGNYNLAWMYTRLNDYVSAGKLYKKLSELFPKDPMAQYLSTVMEGENLPSTAPGAYIEQLFDYYAPHYEADLKNIKYRVPKLFKKIFEQFFTEISHERIVLDLGCGTGVLGEILQPYAKKLIGVDLSKNMMEIAKDKEIYHELILGDLRDGLKNFQNEINLICASDTLVYVGDLREIFNLCVKALKPDGWIIFNTEALEGGEYKVKPTGRFGHTVSYIQSLLKETGLKLMKLKKINLRIQGGLPLLGEVWVAKKGG